MSGCQYVLDSSKNLIRLKRLWTSGCFDLRVLFLIRSPLGVVYSHVRKGRNWKRHAHRYVRSHMAARRVLETVPHYTVRYERLAKAPEQTLRGVMDWLGLPFQRSQLAWPEHPHHNVAGNGMRFSDDPAIRPDERWKTALPLRQQLHIRWITLPTRLPGTWAYERFPSFWKEPTATYLDRRLR